MIIPMLMKIDFGALHQVKSHWKGIGVTLFVNWAVKPFSMALLAWLFIRGVFAPWLPAEQLDSYVAGLILLAAAPCTAMVFVWSRLTGGDPYFTLSQVALNDSHHDLRLRADRGAAARALGHRRALGHAADLGGALYRHPGRASPRSGASCCSSRARRASMRPWRPWATPPSSPCSLTLVLLFAFQGERSSSSR